MSKPEVEVRYLNTFEYILELDKYGFVQIPGITKNQANKIVRSMRGSMARDLVMTCLSESLGLYEISCHPDLPLALRYPELY